jgi:hypothetical protein
VSTNPKPLATLCPEPLEVGPAPSHEELLASEQELRKALLVDATADDGVMDECPHWLLLTTGNQPLACVPEGRAWYVGLALAETRLLDRRIHQMGEDK